MDLPEFLFVYLYGFLVWTTTMLDGSEPVLEDIAISAIVAIFWPIHFPAMVLKKILR